jgi:hypothetical protein
MWLAIPSQDLSRLYRELARKGMLFACAETERVYEIGAPESLLETSTFLTRVSART